jgi:hypothetical protein
MATGLEVLGATAGAFQLVELSFRVYQNLSRFISKAAVADTVASELLVKISHLQNTTNIVASALRYRGREAKSNPPAKEELEIWDTINSSLDDCNRMLQRFEDALEGLLDRSDGRLGWLQKALLQRKLDRRDPAITNLENKIDRHLQILQIYLLCLQV